MTNTLYQEVMEETYSYGIKNQHAFYKFFKLTVRLWMLQKATPPSPSSLFLALTQRPRYSHPWHDPSQNQNWRNPTTPFPIHLHHACLRKRRLSNETRKITRTLKITWILPEIWLLYWHIFKEHIDDDSSQIQITLQITQRRTNYDVYKYK